MPYIGNQPVAVNVTSTDILDGTISNADIAADAAIAISKLDGVTATNTELNILDGATLTTTELNYVDGVTSAIQTQLNAKLETVDISTYTGDVDITGELVVDSYNETYAAVTSTSNATTVDCEAGNTFMHTLTENTTFTFSNPPASGTAYTMTIEIIQDASASGFTVTWPTSVDWPSATAPTLTATADAVDVFVFTTRDGGTTWYGFTAGLGIATPA